MFDFDDLHGDFLRRIAADDMSVFEPQYLVMGLFRLDDVSRFHREYRVGDYWLTPLVICSAMNAKNAVNELLSKNDKGEYRYPHVIDELACNENSALFWAVKRGNIESLERFLEKDNDGNYEFPKVIQKITATASVEKDLLMIAADQGHLAILERLLKKEPNDSYEFPRIVEKIAFFNNYPLRIAASKGHLEIIERLLKKNPNGTYEFPAVISNPSSLQRVLYNAYSSGNDRIFERLMARSNSNRYEIPGMGEIVAARNNEIFQEAAQWGRASFVDYLLSKDDRGRYRFPAVVRKVSAMNNRAFRYAAERGSLAIVERLLAKNPDGSYEFPSVVRNIAADRNHALRYAARRDHLEVVERLLAKNTDGSYEFPDVVENITAVDNEAICMANRNRNSEICMILLEFPQVRDYAIAHYRIFRAYLPANLNPDFIDDFDELPARVGPDLTAMAANNESSMVGLTEAELEHYEFIQDLYQAEVDLKGVDNLIAEIKLYNLKRFHATRPTFQIGSQSVILPMTWDRLERLKHEGNWDGSTIHTVLRAYYENRYHCAYRFLSIPNRWISPAAEYVIVDENNTHLRHANFEQYKNMLALFWTAVKDEEEALKAGCTVEQRKEFFCDQLARMGRQHNWDKYRINLQTQRREQYDDLEGDKPSCDIGLKRGIFESLLFSSIEENQTIIPDSVLNEILREKVYEFYGDYFNGLDSEKKSEIRQGLLDYFESFGIPPAILNVPEEVIQAIKTSIEEKFPNAKISGYPSVEAYLTKTFELTQDIPSHFLKFYSQFNLSDHVDQSNQLRPS